MIVLSVGIYISWYYFDVIW